MAAENLDMTEYQTDTLTYETEYYWMITASDENATTIGTVWNFTTKDELE